MRFWIFLLFSVALMYSAPAQQENPNAGLRLAKMRTGLSAAEVLQDFGQPYSRMKRPAWLSKGTADIQGFFTPTEIDEAWVYTDSSCGAEGASYITYIFFSAQSVSGILIDFFGLGGDGTDLPEVGDFSEFLGIERPPDEVKKYDAAWSHLIWYRSKTVIRLFASGTGDAMSGFGKFRIKTLMMRAETEEERSARATERNERGGAASREVAFFQSSDGHSHWVYESSPPATPSLEEVETWDGTCSQLLRATGSGCARVRLTIASCGGSPCVVQIIWLQFDDPKKCTGENRRKMALLAYMLASKSIWKPGRSGGAPGESTIEVNITMK